MSEGWALNSIVPARDLEFKDLQNLEFAFPWLCGLVPKHVIKLHGHKLQEFQTTEQYNTHVQSKWGSTKDFSWVVGR